MQDKYLVQDFSSVYDPDKRRSGANLFSDLLQECATSCPEMRIKFTSPHPKDFSDDVLQVLFLLWLYFASRHRSLNGLHTCHSGKGPQERMKLLTAVFTAGRCSE